MQSDRTKIEQIEVISLDVWGTIIGINPTFSRLRMELLFSHLGDSIRRDNFYAAFKEMKIATEELSEQEGRHIGFAERLNHLARTLGLTLPADLTALEKEQNKICLDHPPFLLGSAIPGLFYDIKNSGKKLVIISNTGLVSGAVVEQVFDNYGIRNYIDKFVFSDRTNLAKPNPKIFHEALGEPNPKALHIGDNLLADYEGAKGAGFSALHLTLTDDNITRLRQILKLGA